MKYLVMAASVVLVLAGCGKSTQSNKNKNSHAEQQKYLPEGFKDLWLGMSFEELAELRPGIKEVNSGFDFRRTYVDNPSIDGVFSVVYYVNNEGPEICYEIMIEYVSSLRRDQVAETTFGEPNYKEIEWLFDSGEKFKINCWLYQNKVILAGLIEGTEWDPADNE
jgi:hypothetical protein